MVKIVNSCSNAPAGPVAGLSAARARGRLGGRPGIAKTKINAAVQLYNKKELTVNEICKTIGISKATLYKYVHQK